MKIIVDTSVLMGQLENFKETVKEMPSKSVGVSFTALSELDHLKENENVDKSSKARKALDFLNIENKIDFIKDINTKRSNDDTIIYTARRSHDKLWTLDNGQKIKARALGVEIYEGKEQEDYKGYKKIVGTTDTIDKFFEESKNTFHENEYLIIKNTDTDTESEMKYKNGKFINLMLPNKRVVHALNANQRCALDLLIDKSVPIKIIVGTYGSGKTMLSVKVAMDLIKSEDYNTIMFVRNPIVSGEEIGFLPGSKEEKTTDFFKPMLQYIHEFEMKPLMLRDAIKLEIVSFMKGMSVDDTFMIIDEAEDLNLKLIKLIGTRIGKDSCGVFVGDYKQAENKYKDNNGLIQLIEKTKNNPLVGVIYLDADVRSSASKVFADLE